MADPEKTDPNFQTRVKDITARADGPADKILRSIQAGVNWCFDRAIGSAWTPWIIVAVVLLLVWAGVRVTR